MRNLAISLLLVLGSVSAHALSLSNLSNADAVAGLKEALKQGATNAVGRLGKTDGYLGDVRVKIPLPEPLAKVDGALHRFGLGKYGDDLVVTMNRAAEAAVPEAKALIWNAVKEMSIQDAKNILTGGNTAATEYFRGKTTQPLTQKFLPIVHKATDRVQLAQKYDEFAGKAVRFGLLDEKQANLENYVTQKALDGLFFMMAEEEKAIRADPIRQGSKILSKVFGALLGK